MATHAPDVEAALIEGVRARVRERVAAGEREQAEEFVRQYYRRVPSEDLHERDPLDLYGAAIAHWGFARERAPGEAKVRVSNPTFEQHGWQTTHTVVELVTDDMPFLVDSVAAELGRLGAGVHLLIHPVMRVRRDPQGRLTAVLVPGAAVQEGEAAESFIHVEVDRHGAAAELEAIRERLLFVLGQVRAAVEDWPAMRRRAHELIAELREAPAWADRGDFDEAAALLGWMDDEHFTFLGFREYELATEAGEEGLCALPGSGLGILRDPEGARAVRRFTPLPPRAAELAREPVPLVLTKANARSTIHRPTYLDYVGVKRFDADGAVVGERRFLGLYTTAGFHAPTREVPVLRRKVQAVLARAAFPPGSHAEKALIDILETYPRDELFQIPDDELSAIALGIVGLGERQRVRLFARRDRYERFVSFLVFLPRDRFNTRNRERVQAVLREALDAESVDFALRLSESVLVRLQMTARLRPGAPMPDFDAAEIERRIVEVTRSWTDELHDALLEEAGEEEGTVLFRRYADAFPAGYREDRVARSAVADIRQVEALDGGDGQALSLYQPLEAPAGRLRCKLYRRGESLTLSEVLPTFEAMGLRVRDERPYEITPRDGPPTWLYDFGVEYAAEGALDVDAVRERFHDAFARVWGGEAEEDGFNALVLRAGLDWRDVTVLRAIARYLRQLGTTFSDRYMERVLAAHPDVAAALVRLFRARFDPGGVADSAGTLTEEIEAAIDAVESLDEDRILRNFLAVVRAMLRTNHFQRAAGGVPKPYLSFKVDPSRIPLAPRPRPRYEIFVHSPRVEGVHLRGGAVARGGLRWSDRPEDFRTEILGLLKAQTVKNALIVPVGAKGGFVVKRPPDGREALRDEVADCYRTFIAGLLDLTDTVAGGRVVPPPDVLRHDGDDPYLVVAADKGTATFSDTANAVAEAYRFWLGDAFASGGSTGYDHKAMGITARSAWESVRRHFREAGTDIDTTDFTVVGIGDMSGDVFGNGMLLSPHIRLVGAFDHRHVFLDPDPDPATSFAERRRLFELPRSSWADYDTSRISEGGGVWPRTAKAIPISEPAQLALGIDAEVLTPGDLIRALLRAPVDLLWNGGIGTYVKASGEANGDVGDKANDGVRIDGSELRCRVVGEGGNLGLTQRGRVEYALGGGRVNTDAIDNAGGVNTSDHEVNIKVLLDAVVADGELTRKQRNRLLAEMTDAVAERVLRGSRSQVQALSLARAQAPAMLDVHDRFMRRLESEGRLDRAMEALPDGDVVAERRAARTGLTQPELAVLLAHSKITLHAALLDSDVPEDPWLAQELHRYFPPPLPERFAGQLGRHQLRREIVATRVTNALVDHGGISFVFRLQEETGAEGADVTRAYAVARDVFDMGSFWGQVEALGPEVGVDTHVELLLEARRLTEHATRWLLRRRPRPLDIRAEVERFADGAAALAGALPGLLAGDEREAWQQRVEALREAGVPEALARRAAGLRDAFAALDVVVIADATGAPPADVMALHFVVGRQLHLHRLRDHIAALPRQDRWHAMARAALRDDVLGLHADLTADVVRSGRDLPGWIAARRDAVERSLAILADIQAVGTYDLTTLPVALRAIRNILSAGGANPP